MSNPACFPATLGRFDDPTDRTLIDWLTSGSTTGVESGFEALARALDREEAAGD